MTVATSFLWGISALPLGVYVIAQDLNVPLIVQPQFFGLFALLSWCQCLYYSTARSRKWCIAVLCGTLVLWGGLEAALVFALRVSVLSLSLQNQLWFRIGRKGRASSFTLSISSFAEL